MRLEDLVLGALRPRGALAARLLSGGEVEEVRRLEREHSERVTPWGRVINRGALECLGRRFVVAVATDAGFKWPSGPYAVVIVGGRVVGAVDEGGVRIDRALLAGSRGGHEVVVLPLRIPELEEVLENPCAASPSPPAHSYLLRLLSLDCAGCGTLLVGFDGAKRP